MKSQSEKLVLQLDNRYMAYIVYTYICNAFSQLWCIAGTERVGNSHTHQSGGSFLLTNKCAINYPTGNAIIRHTHRHIHTHIYMDIVHYNVDCPHSMPNSAQLPRHKKPTMTTTTTKLSKCCTVEQNTAFIVNIIHYLYISAVNQAFLCVKYEFIQGRTEKFLSFLDIYLGNSIYLNIWYIFLVFINKCIPFIFFPTNLRFSEINMESSWFLRNAVGYPSLFEYFLHFRIFTCTFGLLNKLINMYLDFLYFVYVLSFIIILKSFWHN